jgi:Flp pilus assembly protein TadG
VEFAVVVPLLLLVLTGIFSFGIIFNQYEVLTNATNSAARYFAASRDASKTSGANTMAPSGDACAYVATVVNGDSPNLTATSLKYKIVYTVAATKAPSTLANSTNAPSCSSLSMTGGDTVTVTVTYPVSTALFGWATQNYTLSASSTELVQ